MAKKKKGKLEIRDIMLTGLSVFGAALSVLGLFMSWFVSEFLFLDAEYYGLFSERLDNLDSYIDSYFNISSFFPVGTVQAFGIIAAVVAVIAAIATIIKTFGIMKVGFIPKLLLSAVTIVFGIIVLVFAFNYVGNFNTLESIMTVSVFIGAYFTSIGSIVAGGALLLK